MNSEVQVENPEKLVCRSRQRGQSGSIFRRGEFWTITYRSREKTPEGKRKQIWEGGFRTKEAAKARLDEVLGAIRTNRYVGRSDILFKTFCTDWRR